MDTRDHPAIDKPYVVIILALMFVVPGASVAIELALGHAAVIATIGKWFAFWSIGVRLVSAGVRQVKNPAFTAKTIFHATSDDSLVIVRELGFANLCLGSIGVVSLGIPSWRIVAACAGGLFFAIAGVQHLVIRKSAGPNEILAMVSNLFLATVMGVYIVRFALS